LEGYEHKIKEFLDKIANNDGSDNRPDVKGSFGCFDKLEKIKDI
jgi:hypothetical protein